MVRLKENYENTKNMNFTIFQFLMVRLKAFITIGEGLLKNLFQFLMVRLKVKMIKMILIMNKNFNSLWCD